MRGKVSAGTPVGPPAAQLGAHEQMHLQQAANLIQVPDISRKLVTRYGLREKAPSPTLAAEVVPVVLVDDLVGESDLIRPRIKPAAGSMQQTATSQYVCQGLVNPANSGVIIHVYYLVLSSTVVAQWNLTFTGTPYQGVLVGSSGYRNGLFPNQLPVGTLRGNVSATPFAIGGVVEMRLRSSSAGFGVFPFDAVLDEGQGLQVVSPAAISGTHECSVVWSEEAKR